MGRVFTLIYISRAAMPLREADFRLLMRQARSNNGESGVTGVLIHKEGEFIQVLEGEQEVVEATFSRIHADERHESVRVVHRGFHPRRAFADWSMALEHPEEAAFNRVMGFLDQSQRLDDPGEIRRLL